MKKTHAMMNLMVLLIMVAFALTGCENPVSDGYDREAPDTARYLRENSKDVEASGPVIVMPETTAEAVTAIVGGKMTIMLSAGQAPFIFTVEPDLGYVTLMPSWEDDRRTFAYTAEKPGKCLVTVKDRQKRADEITFLNVSL